MKALRCCFLLSFLSLLFSCSYNELDDISSSTLNGENNSQNEKIVTLKNGVQVVKIDTTYFWEDDILLSKEQLDILAAEPVTKSAYIMPTTKRWLGNIVFYQFPVNFDGINKVRSAMSHIEQRTNIRFWEKTTGVNDFVSFVDDQVNNSYVGRIGGSQTIRLATGLSSNTGSAIHEICHALGLFHEHNRQDRDNYVNINWSNIKPEAQHNFKKYRDAGYQGTDHGSFDFQSVMIYPSSNSFAIDRSKFTHTRKDGGVVNNSTVLSTGDINALNSMYPKSAPNDIVYFTRQWEEYPYTHGGNTTDKYVEYTFITRLPVQKDEKIYIDLYEEAGGSGQESYPPYEHTEQITIPRGSRSVKFTVLTESRWQNGPDFYNEIKEVRDIRYSFTKQN